jgi:S-adenosylmethionine hydrolase
VVDPGVGTERRRRVREIIYFDDFPYFTLPTTFEGRDIFAPAAAMLASGYPPPSFGNEVAPSSMVELEVSFPEVKFDGEMTGEIVRFDSFGNAITNISGHIMARGWMSVQPPRLSLSKFSASPHIRRFRKTCSASSSAARQTPVDETPGE